MKSNFGSGDGGVKGFFVQHGEKLGLIMAVAIGALIFAIGYGVETIPPDKTPLLLANKADEAKRHINIRGDAPGASESTMQVYQERRKHDFDLDKRVKRGRLPIDPSNYPIPAWNRPPRLKQGPRTDPEIYKPLELEVEGAWVAVAWKARTGADSSPLDELELAKLDTEQKSRTVTSRPKPDKGRGGADGDEDGPFAGYPGPGGKGGRPRIPGIDDLGDEDGDVGSEGGSPSGYPSGVPGASGTEDGTYKRLSAKQLRDLPGVALNTGLGTGKVVPGSMYIISVTALVQHEKQWLEYEKVFSNSLGYDLPRDLPQYSLFKIERADVTDDPAAAPADMKWVELPDSQRFRGVVEQYFAGTGRDDIDVDYFDAALTMPIPPVMLHDYNHIIRHEKVPTRASRAAATAEGVDPRDALDPTNIDDILKGPIKPSGDPSRDGGGYPAPGGGPGGYPMPPGLSDSSDEDDGFESDPYASGGAGVPGVSDPTGDGGMGGYGGLMGTAAEAPSKPYKMIRFFDLWAKPGRTYRYRVSVRLEDPNNPSVAEASGSRGPELNMSGIPSAGNSNSATIPRAYLHDSVVQRLADVEKQNERIKAQNEVIKRENEILKRDKKPLRSLLPHISWRDSEWSDPSPPISIPARVHEALAGTAKPATQTQLGGGDYTYDKDEPSGTVVTSIWDHRYAVRVPAELDVEMSSVLNFTKNADVIHPVDRSVRRILDYKFNTNAIVLDIRGGDKLPSELSKRRTPGEKQEPPKAPGEFLILDADGNLIVRNELDDADAYRQLMLIDDSAETQALVTPGYPGPGQEGEGTTPGFGGFIPPPGGPDAYKGTPDDS